MHAIAGLVALGCVVLVVPVNGELLTEARESEDTSAGPLVFFGGFLIFLLRGAVWQPPAAPE